MKKQILFALLLAWSVCFFSACSDDDDCPIFLEVGKDVVDFKNEASTQEVPIYVNVDSWTAKADKDWCTVTPNGKVLVVSVTESGERYVREGTITVTAGSQSRTFKIRQLGYEPAILISEQNFDMGILGGDITFDVTTNVEVKIELPAWIVEKPKNRANEMITTTHTYTVKPTDQDAERQDNIVITEIAGEAASDENPPVTASILVKQKGLGDYSGGDGDDVKDDIKIKVVDGTASSEQAGEEIDKSFDGDFNTIYHSSWNNSPDDYFPITLTYNFEEVSDVDYLVYYPRTSGYNGYFKEVEILYSENGSDFTKVLDKDFQGSAVATKVTFDTTLKAKTIRFVVKSGAGDNKGFVSCSEMEFYTKNPENFDYSTLFTDETCTKLKAGITEEDINKCEFPFFKNIAFYILRDKYPFEFRVDEFKAYPNPDVQSKTHKTSPYSILDNPTGISVSEGENLIVLVGDTYGHNIGIRVQNLDKPDGDGFGGASYSLSTGTNKINIKEKGLVYIIYHTPVLDDASAKPIKIHFASGTINGYFDSQKHDKARWAELINNATDKHFDLVGKYSHLTFETADFRSHTANGKDLIDIYDELVSNEQELMGLVKYDKMFRNRMYFNVMYHSYMYATSYHTGYNKSTMAELCNEKKLRTTACWGPAHEVGHMNQTRPGLKWLGTTEVTNNIMSEYIQTSIFGQDSRIQTEDMFNDGYRNRYSKAWTSIIVSGSPHAWFKCYGDQEDVFSSDVFCKLVPFWQLELYFGRVLGKTPLQQSDRGGFYPDVYEYVRTNADLSTPGLQQTEFVYIASKIAGYNLLDFFTKWGFLTPIKQQMDDYGNGTMEVTQARIDEIKNKVEALGFRKPDVALEYISDNNWELYKTKPAVVRGTASRNGKKITMQDWRNVVTYEVKDADGHVIFISDGVLTPSTTAWFELTFDWDDTYRVYAVAADGVRTLVNLN